MNGLIYHETQTQKAIFLICQIHAWVFEEGWWFSGISFRHAFTISDNLLTINFMCQLLNKKPPEDDFGFEKKSLCWKDDDSVTRKQNKTNWLFFGPWWFTFCISYKQIPIIHWFSNSYSHICGNVKFVTSELNSFTSFF